MRPLIKRKLQLVYLPEELSQDFEKEVLEEHYFKRCVHDLETLAYLTDHYILFRNSFQTTGDSFSDSVKDAILYATEGQKLINRDTDGLRLDLILLFHHYRMFYCDRLVNGQYDGLHNMFCKQIW